MIDLIRSLLGLALPVLIGVALLSLLRSRSKEPAAIGEWAWIAGAGTLVGFFVLTLWMRLLSRIGVPFGLAAIALPIALTGVALAWYASRGQALDARSALRRCWRVIAGAELSGWQRAVWLGLVAWMAFRSLLLLFEVAWRPLYPWDAWTQWATKAKVWYSLGTMAPFGDAAQWGSATSSIYFDAAPHYPPTVPLLQVWQCIALGRWDDALMNLPWWCFGLALALAVYGFLRSADVAPLPALIGTWFVASLPIANVHVALAGYADLPLAAFFTVGTLAGLRWTTTRRKADAALALLLLLAATQTKTPGVIWALTLVPGLIVALSPKRGTYVVLGGAALAALIFAVLARTGGQIFNYQVSLDFNLPWRSLFDAYFTFANWHLLGLGVIGACLVGWRRIVQPPLAPLTFSITAGLTFLLVVFGFTNARDWVEDQTTVNRATLHLAPLLVVWMVLVVNDWQARSKRQDEGDATPAVATPATGT